MVKKYKSLLLKNVRLVDTGTRSQSPKDILITDGVITNINARIDDSLVKITYGDDVAVYNANGRPVVPSFVDMHTHLRDPGFEYKEDIATGTLAAVAGGYCAIVSMPNTKPVTDSPEILSYIKGKAANFGSCAVYPAAAITLGQMGKELCDFDALAEAGACAFTDDGNPVSDVHLMREAMKKCASKDHLIISHAEDLGLTLNGVVNEGRISKLMMVAGIPNSSEDVATARDIILAEETGCRLHIAHVSTRGSVSLVREAKKRGVRVTAETCPHYFCLTDNDIVFYGVNAKMKPPLRGQADVDAIIDGLADGTIDCISTDHAPHSDSDKGTNIAGGAFGITGLQTAFPAAYTYLVLSGRIDIYRLVEVMCINPAKIIGADNYELGAGEVKPGKRAALTILDVDADYRFEKSMIMSKSTNTPFVGMTFVGKTESVISGTSQIFFK